MTMQVEPAGRSIVPAVSQAAGSLQLIVQAPPSHTGVGPGLPSAFAARARTARFRRILKDTVFSPAAWNVMGTVSMIKHSPTGCSL
jgi:hypothetical protein